MSNYCHYISLSMFQPAGRSDLSDVRGDVDSLKTGKHRGLGCLLGARRVNDSSSGLACRDEPGLAQCKCPTSAQQSLKSGRGLTE